MKIRAAVLEEFAKPMVVQELDLAEPRTGEVLVRLEACGVCHTDLFTASGVDPSGYSPTVLGHEGMGGLGAGDGCRLTGAERIICADVSEDRLELAKGQGATDTIVANPDVVAQILEMTGGFGADFTFEATGLVQVMQQAVESARMGWGLCTIAGVAGKGETVDIIPRSLMQGRRVQGPSFGGVRGRDQVPELAVG